MSTQTLKENKMGTMSIGKLLVNMALPMIISMIAGVIIGLIACGIVSLVYKYRPPKRGKYESVA